MWPESHTFTLKGFLKHGVPQFLLLYYEDQRQRSGLEDVWEGKHTETNLDRGWHQRLTWTAGRLYAAFSITKCCQRRAETYTHELSCRSLLYLNPNTHSGLERRFCLGVQWRGRRWRAMSYFITAGKNKQLMQTLDIPAGTFLPRAPRCQLRNSWVKPVRKPSRREVFLKPRHNYSLCVICQARLTRAPSTFTLIRGPRITLIKHWGLKVQSGMYLTIWILWRLT